MELDKLRDALSLESFAKVEAGPQEFPRAFLNVPLVKIVKTRSQELVREFTDVLRIFIGYSPDCAMTQFSGCVWPVCDGNAILLKLSDLDYVHVGWNVLQFKTRAPVQDFVSLAGNNNVPYPYAEDTAGNVYLFLDKVVLLKQETRPDMRPPDANPYDYWYHANLHPTLRLWMKERPWEFRFAIDPRKRYEELTTEFGPMGVCNRDPDEKGNQEPRPLSSDDYVELQQRWGSDLAVVPLDVTEVLDAGRH